MPSLSTAHASRPCSPARLWRALIGALFLCSMAAQATTLRVAVEDVDNRPYAYVDDNGRLTGFHTEIVLAVAQQLGWEVQFIPVPWARAQNMLPQGTADAVTYIGRTAKRLGYAVFLPGNQLHVQHVSLYIRRRDSGLIRYTPPIGDMMRTWRFGAPRGYFVGDEIANAQAEGFPLDQTAKTPEKLIAMLMAGRIDVAAAETMTFQIVEARIRNVRAHVVALPDVTLKSIPMYIAFKRQGDGPELAQRFAAAYAVWRESAEYAQYVERFQVADRLPDDFQPRATAEPTKAGHSNTRPAPPR